VVRIISACYIALFYASLDNQTHPLTGTVAVKRTRAKHCRPARFATGHGQPAKVCTRQAETVLVRHDAKAIVFAQPLGARKGLVGSLTPALTQTGQQAATHPLRLTGARLDWSVTMVPCSTTRTCALRAPLRHFGVCDGRRSRPASQRCCCFGGGQAASGLRPVPGDGCRRGLCRWRPRRLHSQIGHVCLCSATKEA